MQEVFILYIATLETGGDFSQLRLYGVDHQKASEHKIALS